MHLVHVRRLKSFTTLAPRSFHKNVSSLAFLSDLSELRTLRIQILESAPDLDVVRGISACKQLTDLTIACVRRDACSPLAELEVSPKVRIIRDSDPQPRMSEFTYLAESLWELALIDLHHLPTSEMENIYGLTELRELDVSRAQNQQLSSKVRFPQMRKYTAKLAPAATASPLAIKPAGSNTPSMSPSPSPGSGPLPLLPPRLEQPLLQRSEAPLRFVLANHKRTRRRFRCTGRRRAAHRRRYKRHTDLAHPAACVEALAAGC